MHARRGLTRRSGVLVAAVAASALAPSAWARADIDLAVERSPTTVTAAGGHVLWSRSADDGRFRLVMSSGGVVRELPIASRRVPFDVDAGVVGGRVIAVYSRCRRDPTELVRGTLPRWTSGTGCRLYAFDAAAGKERRLRPRGVPSGSQAVPSAWGDRLAFAVSRRSGGRVHIFTVHGRRDAQRVRGGSLGQAVRGSFPGPMRIDVRGRRLGHLWDGVPTERCAAVTPAVAPARAAEIWLVDLREERRRRLASACESTSPPSFTGLALGSSRLLYGEAGDRAAAIAVPLSGGTRRRVELPPGVISLDADREALYTVRSTDAGYVVSRWP